jgi:Zn-dependent protease
MAVDPVPPHSEDKKEIGGDNVRPGARRQAPNDGGSFEIAVIGGIPIRIHITFLLLLGWIGVAGSEAGKGRAGSGLLFIILLFACVLLHELSHATVATRYGVRTLSITLYPIGGVALLEKSPRPRQEFWIALAGPLLNFVLAGNWGSSAAGWFRILCGLT